MRFSGRVALVTGAGSGIGAATAHRLAAEGAVVGVLDRDGGRAEAVAGEIVAAGGRALALTADVAETGPMQDAVARLVAEVGPPALVVANAGINGHWAPIDDLTPEEWDLTTRTNLRGTYLTLHLTVPFLKAAGGGAVVIVASVNGNTFFSLPGATAYSAAKAGQAAMAAQLAVELARHRIRVNAVLPGQVTTDIGRNTWRRNTDAARWPVVYPEGHIPLTGATPARPEDVADAIAMLLSDDARHITGVRLAVDGGQSVLR